MLTTLFIVVTVMVVITGVPILVFTSEIIAALLIRHKRLPLVETPPGIAVVIPAHNEVKMIGATLDNLRTELSPDDRLIVIADNCTDATAAVARVNGAEVIERHVDSERGKGYALQFALDFLAIGKPPSVVVFVDADCRIEPGALRDLAATAYNENQPVQACYLLGCTIQAPRLQRISAFALRVKNDLRPLGCSALQIPCVLTGSGIAMPWHIAMRLKLGTGNIVEDMALGVDLVAMGFRPLYLRRAQVSSALPEQNEAQVTQRTRWEHGHLLTIPSALWSLLGAAWRQRAWAPLGYALEIAVPPLSFLLTWSVAVWTLTVLVSISTGYVFPAIAMMILLIVLGGGVFFAWHVAGRDLLVWSDLVGAPWYVARKLPSYVALALGKRVAWKRTRRQGE